MTTITVDAIISTKLLELADKAELRDESGKLLGYFDPVPKNSKSMYEGYYIPDFTEEQLRERESQPGGKSLKQIWAELEKRA